MMPPDPGFSATHPPTPVKNWDKFNVSVTTLAKRIEEDGAAGRTARKAMVKADDANTQNVGIGPDQDANFHDLAAGETFTIPSDGGLFSLGEWWIKAASGTQTVKVTYQ